MADFTKKISVCILTYNHEKYIEECIESVISQEVEASLEIIIGDDCSTDNTRNIISKFAEKYPAIVFPIFHDKNIGGVNNQKSVIKMATGDYIAHLDGDDFWFPGKLKRQLNFLESHSECAAVYCNTKVIDVNNNTIGVFNNKQPEIFDINYLLENGNFLNHSSLFYIAMLKDEFINLQVDFMDYQINLILASIGKLGYLNDFLVAYRWQSSSSVLKNSSLYIEKLLFNAIFSVDVSKVRFQSFINCICISFLTILKSGVLNKRIGGIRYWMSGIFSSPKVNVIEFFKASIIMACKIIYKKTINNARDCYDGDLERVFYYR